MPNPEEMVVVERPSSALRTALRGGEMRAVALVVRRGERAVHTGTRVGPSSLMR